MNDYQQSIIVKTQLEALHHWETIPDEHPSHYLKNLHRHVFHIEMRFIVSHLNREIEFIEFKQKIDLFLQSYFFRCPQSGLININNFSCEMLGKCLLQKFEALGCYWVQVLEDGEMGAIVESL